MEDAGEVQAGEEAQVKAEDGVGKPGLSSQRRPKSTAQAGPIVQIGEALASAKNRELLTCSQSWRPGQDVIGPDRETEEPSDRF